MPTFTAAIRAHGTQVNELHKSVRDTYSLRDNSKMDYEAWLHAAQRFRKHHSEVDELCDACISNGLLEEPRLRSFAFDYLTVDPYYFRSGYFVEKLLRHIRKLQLLELEKMVLRNLILNRIQHRALRNFRQICRMIPIINDEEFQKDITHKAMHGESEVQRHAIFALEYFPFAGRVRGVGFTLK